MSLTGPLFLSLVIGATTACLLALVAFWPRLAGRRVRAVAARLGLLLGVNALVLLSAAVLLNAQFLFFADWADLHGAVSGSASTTTVAGAATPGRPPVRKCRERPPPVARPCRRWRPARSARAVSSPDR